MPELIETEGLIIGCGVAGGTVALRLADARIPVTVVTRAAEPNDTNTPWAQGGKHGVLRRCPHQDTVCMTSTDTQCAATAVEYPSGAQRLQCQCTLGLQA